MLGMTFWLRKAFKAYDTLSLSKVIPTEKPLGFDEESHELNYNFK